MLAATAALVIAVPGQIRNPLNSTLSLWKHRRLVKAWRDRTAEHARVALLLLPAWREVDPRAPKRVTFHATVARVFDDDNLRAAIKPLRDGLRDARVIHDDDPGSGHRFAYEQARGIWRGVRITVELEQG